MYFFRLLILLITFMLAACSGGVNHKASPASSYQQPQKASTIAVAMQQLGVPYRYGGKDPSGFDCSGLVYYSYRQTGRSIPRNTTGQLSYSKKIHRAEMRPGDLVFFRISKNKVSHVGIYIGGNRFVHAPSRGKRVQVSYLDNSYWQTRFITAGRI
jgi:cell wall-associated NlpC family hydrolase